MTWRKSGNRWTLGGNNLYIKRASGKWFRTPGKQTSVCTYQEALNLERLFPMGLRDNVTWCPPRNKLKISETSGLPELTTGIVAMELETTRWVAFSHLPSHFVSSPPCPGPQPWLFWVVTKELDLMGAWLIDQKMDQSSVFYTKLNNSKKSRKET